MDIGRPSCLLQPLVVPHKLLMGPGPSNCSPRVLQAMGLPVLGHLHDECVSVMDEVQRGLRYAFQTRHAATLAVSASGHGALEAAMSNLLEAGDAALVAVHGLWGQRAAAIARRYDAKVEVIEKAPGENFTRHEIEEGIRRHRPVLFFVTQGESSTGVYQPLEGIGEICRRYNCLFVVDTVASLGGVPVYTDRWLIDVVYSGSQKVLGAPPGLAPISFSPRAMDKVRSRKTAPSVFYWDMNLLCNYWGCFGEKRTYHHTISSSLLYGLREGLAQLAEEGLENYWKRHQDCADQLYEGLQKLGLQLYVKEKSRRLSTVTAINMPLQVIGANISKYAMERYRIEISGGLGPTVGKVLRIGLMGHNATAANVERVLGALKAAVDHVKHSQSKL